MNIAPSPTERANALLASGAIAEAVGLMSDAAGRDDPEALYTLGLWHVFGQPVRRDFSRARFFFGRAGQAGHAQGALTFAVFVAMGAGGPADWRAALALIETAAPTTPAAARQVELLAAMNLDANGVPQSLPATEPLSTSPKVGIVRALFTPDECAHVIGLSRGAMRPSIVADPRTGRELPHPIRTSDGTVMGPIQQDLVVHALNHRIASVSGSRVRQGEPLSVLRYAPGQQYRLHHDCLPGETNQRELTLIAYLNDAYEGGATSFPAADIAFRGEVGDAILFVNSLPSGRVDERSRHAGLPVSSGEKWVCTRWIRTRDFDPWGAYPV